MFQLVGMLPPRNGSFDSSYGTHGFLRQSDSNTAVLAFSLGGSLSTSCLIDGVLGSNLSQVDPSVTVDNPFPSKSR